MNTLEKKFRPSALLNDGGVNTPYVCKGKLLKLLTIY